MPAARINPKIIIPPRPGLLASFWSSAAFAGIAVSTVAATAFAPLLCQAIWLCEGHTYAVCLTDGLRRCCNDVICRTGICRAQPPIWYFDKLRSAHVQPVIN